MTTNPPDEGYAAGYAAGVMDEREACALMAETSKGYPTDLSEAIRSRPSPIAAIQEDADNG